MKGPPVAAFVTPAWNAAGTIGETLRSALAQTRPDIEVLVVDDGSSDGTPGIVEGFARTDPRVRLLRQDHRGPAAARNRAVAETCAPFLCLLDADDLVPPGKIGGQAAFLEANPGVAVVFTPALQFPDGRPGAAIPMVDPGSGEEVEERLLGTGFGSRFPLVSTLIRRSAYEAVGGIREFDPLVEDLDLWVRLAFGGHRFARCEGPPALYRVRAGSRSSHRLDYNEGLLPILRWLWDRRGGLPAERRQTLRAAARFRTLVVAGLRRGSGDTPGARSGALEAAWYSRSAGELAECLWALMDPARLEGVVPPPEPDPWGPGPPSP